MKKIGLSDFDHCGIIGGTRWASLNILKLADILGIPCTTISRVMQNSAKCFSWKNRLCNMGGLNGLNSSAEF